MTPEELAELKALEAAATPGPWFYGESLEDRDFEVSPLSEHWPPRQICFVHFYAQLPSEEIQQQVRADFTLIAAMRNRLPGLLELDAAIPTPEHLELLAQLIEQKVPSPGGSTEAEDEIRNLARVVQQ